MKASEVRKLVENRVAQLNEKDEKMYQKIIDKIVSDIDASTKPIYSKVIFEDLSDYVLNKLRSDGYIIKTNSFRNECSVTISWEKINTEDYI
jgi:hypothetical protein